MGFHSSGVALYQVIATFADENKENLLDVKTIENSDISLQGYVGTSTTTRYSGLVGYDGQGGELTPDQTKKVDQQVIETTEFDVRGNAMKQQIVRSYYDPDTQELVFADRFEWRCVRAGRGPVSFFFDFTLSITLES